jgi:hypothetical protein
VPKQAPVLVFPGTSTQVYLHPELALISLCRRSEDVHFSRLVSSVCAFAVSGVRKRTGCYQSRMSAERSFKRPLVRNIAHQCGISEHSTRCMEHIRATVLEFPLPSKRRWYCTCVIDRGSSAPTPVSRHAGRVTASTTN